MKSNISRGEFLTHSTNERIILPLREFVRQLVEVPSEGGLELGQDPRGVLLQLLPAHAEVRLFQLDPGLLDVVHHGTRLKVINPITPVASIKPIIGGIKKQTCFSSFTIRGKSLFNKSA